MNDKLQELTKKIYEEGLEKGKKEAAEIVANAKKEADKILKDAQKEADKIIDEANKKAEELRKNVQSELTLSSRQAINALKQQLTDLVVSKSVKDALGKSFEDKDFIQKIMLAMVENWDKISRSNGDITIVLPKKDKEKFEAFIRSKVAASINAGIDIDFEEGVKSGFRIGPKDGSFKISFTESDFEQFFRNYLRPRTKKLLFED